MAVHADLVELAGQALVGPLDVGGLRGAASRRRRRRRLAVAAPVLAVLVAVGVVVLGPAPAPQDRLVPAGTVAPPGSLQVAVTSVSLVGGPAGLTVSADPAPVPIGNVVRLTLVWHAAAGGVDQSVPPLGGGRVAADTGAGVLGLNGYCGGWDSAGNARVSSCPAGQGRALPAGSSLATPLDVYPRVAGATVAPGTYRSSVLAWDGRVTVRLVLTVTPRPSPTVSEGVRVAGEVIADHGRGLTVTGRGTVPATVTFTELGTTDQVRVWTVDGSFATTLRPGSYRVAAAISDGSCAPVTLTVGPTPPPALHLTCVDGVSTF